MILIKEDENIASKCSPPCGGIKCRGQVCKICWLVRKKTHAMTLAQRRQANARTMPSSQERIAKSSLQVVDFSRFDAWSFECSAAQLGAIGHRGPSERACASLHETPTPTGLNCVTSSSGSSQENMVNSFKSSTCRDGSFAAIRSLMKWYLYRKAAGTEDALGMRLWHNWFQIFFAAPSGILHTIDMDESLHIFQRSLHKYAAPLNGFDLRCVFASQSRDQRVKVLDSDSELRVRKVLVRPLHMCKKNSRLRSAKGIAMFIVAIHL